MAIPRDACQNFLMGEKAISSDQIPIWTDNPRWPEPNSLAQAQHLLHPTFEEGFEDEGIILQLASERIGRVLQQRIENRRQFKEGLLAFSQAVLNEFGWWAAQHWIREETEFASSQWLISTATPPNLLTLNHLAPTSQRLIPENNDTFLRNEPFLTSIQGLTWHPHQEILERQGARGIVQVDIWHSHELFARYVFLVPGPASFSNSLQICLARLFNQIPPLYQRILTNEELDHRATHDELTGLLNRRGLEAILPHQAILLPGQQERSVFFLDVDCFKTVNDSFGHAVGDELLIEIADRLKKHCRPVDIIARLGGDEFVIVGEGFESSVSISNTASRLLKNICQKFISKSGTEITPQISIGVSKWRNGDYLYESLQSADQQMYQAKSQGGANYSIAEITASMPATSKSLELESLFDFQRICHEADGLLGLKFDIALPNYSAPASMHSLAEILAKRIQKFQVMDQKLPVFLDFTLLQRNTRANIFTLLASLRHYQLVTNLVFVLRATTMTNEANQIARELLEQDETKIAISEFGNGTSDLQLLREFQPKYVFVSAGKDEESEDFAFRLANSLCQPFKFEVIAPSRETLSWHKENMAEPMEITYFLAPDLTQSNKGTN